MIFFRATLTSEMRDVPVFSSRIQVAKIARYKCCAPTEYYRSSDKANVDTSISTSSNDLALLGWRRGWSCSVAMVVATIVRVEVQLKKPGVTGTGSDPTNGIAAFVGVLAIA